MKNIKNIHNTADSNYRLAKDLVRQAKSEGFDMHDLLNALTKKVVKLS